jgi:hypothetical protein
VRDRERKCERQEAAEPESLQLEEEGSNVEVHRGARNSALPDPSRSTHRAHAIVVLIKATWRWITNLKGRNGSPVLNFLEVSGR